MSDTPEADEYYVRGKGLLPRGEVVAAARFAVALREAARGLAKVGGAAWALDVLREEIAEIEAPAKRGAGRPPQPARASDMLLIAMSKTFSNLSAPKLAAKLHSGQPGRYAATELGLEKRIKMIRALSPERYEAFAVAAVAASFEMVLELKEEGEALPKSTANLFREILESAVFTRKRSLS